MTKFKSPLRLTLLFLALSVSLQTIAVPHAEAASGKKQIPSRTLSLDTGYIPSFATNPSMWNLWMEYEYLGTGLFDLVSANTFVGDLFLTRLIWGFGMWYGWNYIENPMFVANHELGHGTRLLARSVSPSYYWNGGSANTSILTFIPQGYSRLNSGAYAAGGATGSSINPTDWSIVVSAGGMNNSMMFAEHVEDEINYNTGHINLFAAYMKAKLDAYNYAQSVANGTGPSGGGDVNTLISRWAAKGYSISNNDFQMGSRIAMYGSLSTFAFGYSMIKYVVNGDPSVHKFALGSFRLPDLSFFLNRNGLSFRSRFGFGSGKRIFPMSVEYIYKGKSTAEVSFGVRNLVTMGGVLKTGSQLLGYVSSAGGAGVRASKDFLVSQKSFITVTGGFFHINSLEGERTVSRLLSNSLGAELWARWTLAY